MRYEVRIAGRSRQVDVDGHGRFLVDGEAVAAEAVETVRGRQWTVSIAGRLTESPQLCAYVGTPGTSKAT